MAPLKQLGRREVLNMVTNPKKMDMDVEIANPVIHLKPNPNSPDYLLIDLGNIKIKNKRITDNARIIKKSNGITIENTHSECYLIFLQDMNMKLVRNNIPVDITLLFHFNILLDMVGFTNEY